MTEQIISIEPELDNFSVCIGCEGEDFFVRSCGGDDVWLDSLSGALDLAGEIAGEFAWKWASAQVAELTGDAAASSAKKVTFWRNHSHKLHYLAEKMA